ncbi:GpE family phage tail protein [Azohydromonas lata]|uniref:GpE family phage tail protein n=1 Tax=Azohydromonas lata TaxID=45677 RepID=A0ABU5ICY7_9BURK|nr:GpE family phage tail protein [Azohydromonas lata]MDZ5456989.1 GpE family phage tail protein [Azohydromonas lata]
MADLAITFHWGPSQLWALSLAELMAWREMARERSEPAE